MAVDPHWCDCVRAALTSNCDMKLLLDIKADFNAHDEDGGIALCILTVVLQWYIMVIEKAVHEVCKVVPFCLKTT